MSEKLENQMRDSAISLHLQWREAERSSSGRSTRCPPAAEEAFIASSTSSATRTRRPEFFGSGPETRRHRMV